MVEDPVLEKRFLSSFADLTTYDLTESRRFLEGHGLSEQDFSRPIHWSCYQSIASCVMAGVPATPDNLAREARKIGGDNASAISLCAFSEQDIGASLDGYAQQLVEVSTRKESARLLEDSLDRLRSGKGTASEIRFRLVNSLQRTRGKVQTKGLDVYVDEVEDHLRKVADGTIKPVTPWYLKKLDQSIGGLQPTLILIGAEPGVGKSALIASAVHQQAVNGHKPFVASLEDEPAWLAWRLVSNDTNRNQFDMRFTKMPKGSIDSVHDNNEKLRKQRANIRTVDGSISGMRIEDLISSINDAIINEGCDSVWIDHLGEILLTNAERTDLEIARHLSLLRGVANRHHVPVVVAAHFKRTEDPSRPPSFRDFANSSGAERKARIALGLRRSPGSDVLSVHVMKQTNGPAGQVIDLDFKGAAAMIVDAEGGINSKDAYLASRAKQAVMRLNEPEEDKTNE